MLEVVGLCWCQAGGSTHPWPAQPRMGKCCPSCRAAGAGGGKLLPRGCGSFAREMCEAGAAWPSSAAQGAGKWSRPGTRAIPAIKERAMLTPCDGGTASLCLTCLI